MTLQRIVQFIADLIAKQFTGRVILDIHCGDISKKIKIERTETIE